MATERFGLMESQQRKKTHNLSWRENKIRELKREIGSLRKQFKESSTKEKPLLELWDILRGKLKNICRAGWQRRRRKERAKKQAAFLSNPFGFARSLLGDERSGNLEMYEEEIDIYLQNSFCDPTKDQEFGSNEMLIDQEPPNQEFNIGTLIWKELQEAVRASRTASSPGSSGVSYIVYKCRTGILKFLWKLLRVIWRRGKIPDQWRHANGIWIPKEEKIELFRIILLLNTKSKIFFRILAWHFSHFSVSNGYIDPSVQKGGITECQVAWNIQEYWRNY